MSQELEHLGIISAGLSTSEPCLTNPRCQEVRDWLLEVVR